MVCGKDSGTKENVGDRYEQQGGVEYAFCLTFVFCINEHMEMSFVMFCFCYEHSVEVVCIFYSSTIWFIIHWNSVRLSSACLEN